MKDGKDAMENMGQFEEGYCLQINTIIETVVVCLPT